MAKKYVYMFEEGNESQRELLGGKGANLAGMTRLGMPVPPGFTVSTEACTQYYNDGEKINAEIEKQIFENLAKLEAKMGKKLGDEADPLLVSVRSGSRASMPGMMDTILNLGLNDKSVEGLAKKTDNARFAYDSYRRFIQMFSDVVMEQKKEVYEKILHDFKEKCNAKSDQDLTADQLKELVKMFKENYKKNQGVDFPQDAKVQMIEATKAVFRSWDNPRAIYYRKMNDIPGDWGTAVNIQSMVFGNKGDTSGTGVAFTRNPATGEKILYGEYLMNAQGEDVVAGIRTPNKIAQLEQQNPAVYKQFVEITQKLESHYRDMQDMEFTIEEGKLYMLQTRNGKRTAAAAVKIAADLYKEGRLTKKEAILKVEPSQVDQLLHPAFDPKALKAATPLASGLNASPGAATGHIVFTAERAKVLKNKNYNVILVREETSPEDIEGMIVASGILTSTGGRTSHAAVVARQLGTCCVCGAKDCHVSEEKGIVKIGDRIFKEGDFLSLDGTTGLIYGEEIKTVPAKIGGDFKKIMTWADKYRVLKVRANADTPRDAKRAYEFGAEGIGLVRTEHMFFEGDRIKAIRKMIVSKTKVEREAALAELLPMQRGDFEALYKEMKGNPVTIRYLDPPLHEFVPHDVESIKTLAREMGLTYEDLKATIDGLHELNPMMGHRGVRLSVTYPEIAAMQTRAVIEAAINVNKTATQKVVPEIMIPLVGEVKELKYVKDVVVNTIKTILKEQNATLDYQIGTMIEIPRAALLADEIAKEAEFFSFGTNDLTQMTFGFSRDDAGKFLDAYYESKIFEYDPFKTVDQNGVGKLMDMAVKLGRKERPNLKCGICGEHGGDPASVKFCHRIGLNYVSCSPYRVPVARLAAAHAALKYKYPKIKK
ncbi:MAG: pyruvate, phosphate dikinase [Erysipelotrichaceae bacterium]|jgi:pyruvate,orthophosphate dikinase|nr:pyruvate, phosphate dikinase [Erysipelotrichaceae bacterium]